MGTTNGSVTYPGWNIDDIRIWGVLPDAECLASPGEVGTIRFLSDGATMVWQRPADMGGPITPVYDVLRSSLPDDFVTAAVCVETDDGTDAVAADTDSLAPGDLFYYLVRAENDCGSGSLGEGSGSVVRSGVDCVSGP
jgi:hypothetical protein